MPVQEVPPHGRVHLVDEAIARPDEAAGSRNALPVDAADGQQMAPDDLLDQGPRLTIVGQLFRRQVLQIPLMGSVLYTSPPARAAPADPIIAPPIIMNRTMFFIRHPSDLFRLYSPTPHVLFKN